MVKKSGVKSRAPARRTRAGSGWTRNSGNRKRVAKAGGAEPQAVSLRPCSYQAPFGTVRTIHASNSLKHKRGVSGLEGGRCAVCFR